MAKRPPHLFRIPLPLQLAWPGSPPHNHSGLHSGPPKQEICGWGIGKHAVFKEPQICLGRACIAHFSKSKHHQSDWAQFTIHFWMEAQS